VKDNWRSRTETLQIDIAHLEERISELEHIVKQLHNTIHYHRKIGEADGFGYWQVG